METVDKGQSYKLALLQHGHVEQLRKQDLVTRRFALFAAEAQRIKATPGITGLWSPIVHIDETV